MHSFSRNISGKPTLHLALCAGWGGGEYIQALYMPAEKITAFCNPEITCRKISEGAATLKQLAAKNNCLLQYGNRPPEKFFGLCNPAIPPRKKMAWPFNSAQVAGKILSMISSLKAAAGKNFCLISGLKLVAGKILRPLSGLKIAAGKILRPISGLKLAAGKFRRPLSYLISANYVIPNLNM